MNIVEYQKKTIDFAVYPGAGEHSFQECLYLTLGLTSEAGEVAGKIKKIIRGDSKQDAEGYLSELSDVLWYLTRLCDNIGITLEDLAEYNIKKLQARLDTDTIKGSGDNREKNGNKIITPNS